MSSVFLLLLLSFFTSLNIRFLESFLLFYLFSFRYLMIRNYLCSLCPFNFLFFNSTKFLLWLINSLFCCSYSMLFGLLSQNPESFFLCFNLRLFNFNFSAIFNNVIIFFSINSIRFFLLWLINFLFCCSFSMLFFISQNLASLFLYFDRRLFNYVFSAIFFYFVNSIRFFFLL
ncbi:LOW QUALITY PROTEIN: hypothetical protein TorRG33x02_211360 [Trema orientale]|uniref:Uncharacterized protein n=1 Tax=Trema orientale TaxID=63057 RepID=A0A2P5EBV2_TREOI|nr:LOW QUALITY PROTEIN: hypothetical protein TorRG33x02_211360 [Trema orientale]